MKTLVTITTVRNFEAACFLKDKLEQAKIDCYFIYSGIIADRSNEIKVQVVNENVEEAFKVMMEIRLAYNKDISEIRAQRNVRKIMVLTDFSKNSEAACHYAIHLAQKLKAEIKLLHVFRNPVTDSKMHSNETFDNYLYDITREAERRTRDTMLEFADKMRSYLAESGGKTVSIHSTIAMGNLLRVMKDISGNYKPDLLVLHTQGRNTGSKSIFNKIAKELVRELNVPLFAIPGPLEVEDLQTMRIIYATDFNEQDHGSLNRLLEILQFMKKKITCVHIDTDHNPSSEDRMDELNEFLRREYGRHSIECILIDHQDIIPGIQEFAESVKCNLLSFTIHKRGIFEMLFKPNLFKKILQESSIPMLIFPS